MIGIPYFPATIKNGKAASVCPVCAAVVSGPAHKHWTNAGHTESDVTKETRGKANAVANEAL